VTERVSKHEHKRPEVERLLRMGLPLKVIATRTGVSDTTIGRWRDEMRAGART